VESCRACAAEMAELRESAAFMESQVLLAEPPPEIWQNVRARISYLQPPAPAPGFLGLLGMHRWAAAAATLTVIAAVGLGLWSYRRYEQTQQLNEYMNAYIQERESQRSGYRVPVLNVPFSPKTGQGATEPAVGRRGYDFNPFVQIDSTSYSNPFRTEAQR